MGAAGATPRDPVVRNAGTPGSSFVVPVIDSTAESAATDDLAARGRRRSLAAPGPLGARTLMHAIANPPASTVALPCNPTASTDRLEREEIIEMICDINRGVGRAWLESFQTEDLRRYLAHLELVLEPRGTVWVREPGAPALERRAA